MKSVANWIILFMFSGIPAYALETEITTAPEVPAFITRTMPETVEVYFEAKELSGIWPTENATNFGALMERYPVR
jgi:hypothetical protein